MLGAFFFGVDGWLSGVSLHWNLCDAEVQQSVWRSTGRGKDGCEMTGRQAAELLGLALDAEGAPWRTHPSSRTSRHIGGARCCCGLFIYGSISFRESTVATTGQSRSADADHPHSTQQAPAIRPETSSEKRWHGGTLLPQQQRATKPSGATGRSCWRPWRRMVMHSRPRSQSWSVTPNTL